MSRGPIRILSFGRPGVVFSLRGSPLEFRFVLILSVPTWERDLVPLVIDFVAFCACFGVVSVLGVGAFLFSECEY